MIKRVNNRDKRVAKAILNVSLKAYEIESRLINYPDFPPLKEKIADIITNENNFFGYFVDDTLAGVIELLSKEDILYIQRLVVHPEYVKQGIGLTLVSQAIQHQRPCFVDTAETNYPAINLYKKVGFSYRSKKTVGNPPIVLVTYARACSSI